MSAASARTEARPCCGPARRALDRLQHLRDKVDRAVVASGLAADDRKFKPHVTLARLKNGRRDRVHRWLSDNAFLSTVPFPVDRFVLFRSHLNRNGASYEALAEYRLGPPANDGHPASEGHVAHRT